MRMKTRSLVLLVFMVAALTAVAYWLRLSGEAPNVPPTPPAVIERPAPATVDPVQTSEPAGVGTSVQTPVRPLPGTAVTKNLGRLSGLLGGLTTGGTANQGTALSTLTPATTAAKPEAVLEDYEVTLQAEQHLQRPGSPGELRITISAPENVPEVTGDWARASSRFTTHGQSALVEPYVPDFEILGESTLCMGLDPSGSTARFTIIPRKTGVLKVGATVRLFEQPNCQGTPLIKQPENLQVEVVVDWLAWATQHMSELWDIFWDKLLTFWALALGVLFGLLLFLLRRQIKQRFGYESRD